MLVPVPITWVAGQVVTAAMLNANVRDAVNFLLAPPTCELSQTVAQSIASGAHTPVTLDSEDLDNDNMHSTVSNTSRVTAQTAGRYQFSGGIIFTQNATNRRACWWTINGVDVNGSMSTALGASVAGGNTGPAARAKSVYMNVGDYVEMIGFQDSGIALSTVATTFQSASVLARWIGTT